MCDPRDLGIAITEDIAKTTGRWEPDLFLYDCYPGGIGLSAPLYKLTPRLLSGASRSPVQLRLRSPAAPPASAPSAKWENAAKKPHQESLRG